PDRQIVHRSGGRFAATRRACADERMGRDLHAHVERVPSARVRNGHVRNAVLEAPARLPASGYAFTYADAQQSTFANSVSRMRGTRRVRTSSGASKTS